MTAMDHLLFALAWVSFGALHSLLARQRAIDLMQASFGDFTRVAYNLIATAHFAAILVLEWRGFPGKTVFDLPLGAEILMIAVQVAGWLFLLAALLQYDLGRFGGLTQATAAIERSKNAISKPGDRPEPDGRETEGPDADPDPGAVEPLVTHGVHRYIRHPLYTAIFLILWGRIFDEAALMTAVWGSLYLLIGTRFEERKLRRIYGDAYVQYQSRVPRFLPFKGRAWTN